MTDRIEAFHVSIYKRLSQRGVTNGSNFNLPLTQTQIADHLGLSLEHLNRLLRMREEHLMTVDRRQVVTIGNVSRLSKLTRGLAEPAHVQTGYFRADQN